MAPVKAMLQPPRGPVNWLAPLDAFGFALAFYPVFGLAAAAAALQHIYRGLHAGCIDVSAHMPFADLNQSVGFEVIRTADGDG